MRFNALVLAVLLSAGQTAWAQQTQPNKSKKEPKTTQTETKPQAKTDSTARMTAYREFFQAQQNEAEGNFVQAVENYKKVIELDPQSPEPHVSLGELYFRNRNLNDSEAEARTAIKLNNDSIGGHRLLGRILATTGLSGAGNKEKIQEAIVQFLEVVRLDKNDAEGWKILGSLYSTQGDSEKALDAYQNLISTGLASFPDLFEMARLYHSKNQFREAAQAARQAFEQSDNNPQAGFLLADSLLRSGQTAEAIEIFKSVIKDNPNSLGLTLGLAEALLFAGNYDEATTYLNKVLENDAKNLRALNLLSKVQRRQGKRQEAITTLKKALEGQDVSESLEIQFELAETYEEMGQIDNAVAAYDEAFNALSNPDGTVSDTNRRNAGIVLQAIVNAYRNAGQRDKALKAIDRMRTALGSTATNADEMLITLLSNEGKHKEALEAVRDAQKRFPNERRFKFLEAQSLSSLHDTDKAVSALKSLFNGSAEDADVYHFEAFIYMDNNRLDEAEKQLRKALTYDEKNVTYLVTLSSILDRAKRFKESEDTLKLVLKYDPDNATALNNLGYFLSERNERLEEALEYIKRAINIDPNNGSFLDSLGWVYFKLGKLDLAQKYLEDSIVYDRRSATVYEHLGDLYQRLARTDEARKYWQKALEYANEPDEIARLKDKIKDPSSVAKSQK